MKGLYKFTRYFGRMGALDGVFIADDSEVAKIIGTEVYFGEALGKHSEIYCDIEEEDIQLKTQDAKVIATLEDIFPNGTVCGWNPLECVENE